MENKLYAVKLRAGETPLWSERGPALGWLDMELTERCNNNCIHCCINLPAGDLAAQQGELTSDEIKHILNEAASLGCLTVRLTGGEPLLRRDFSEIYIFARKLGLKVLVFTNGTLITPDLADLFAKIPPLQKIEITVYGMKRDSYEAVTRSPGSFDAARRGIDLLLERKVPFVVKGVVLPPNKGELGEFSSWAASLPWMDGPPSYALFLDLRCRREPLKNLAIKRLRLSPEEALTILTGRRKQYFGEMRDFCARFMGPAGDKLFSCGAGFRSGCVDARGVVQPCVMLRHPETVYSLENGSLKDCLDRFFPAVREIKATSPDYLARCARCFLHGLCEQCPAKSWTEHGSLDTPVEYCCDIAHLQAGHLGLLNGAERGWEVKDWKDRLSRLRKPLEERKLRSRIGYGSPETTPQT